MEWLNEVIRAYREDPNLVCVIGIILYSDAHPHVGDVFEKREYREALDTISRSRWVVIGSRKSPRRKRAIRRLPRISLNTDLATFPMRGNLTDALADATSEEADQFLETLGVTSDDIPCLLLLVPSAEGDAFTHVIPIEGNSVEKTYASLSAGVMLVTEAVEGIDFDKNRKNAEGVHAAIGLRLQSDRDWKRLKRIAPDVLKWIFGRISKWK